MGLYTYFMCHTYSRTGFTLIELMIVVVIMSILAAVSYSVYSNYFTMSFESEALTSLQQGKMAQIEYYSENDQFSCDFSDLSGFSASGSSYEINPNKDGRRNFTFSIDSCSNGFTMSIKNHSSNANQEIEWSLNCTENNIYSCEPAQIKGTSTLQNIFWLHIALNTQAPPFPHTSSLPNQPRQKAPPQTLAWTGSIIPCR